MKRWNIRIWKSNEYHYPSAWDFVPRLDGYLHEQGLRPCVIVVPGGAYRRCAPQEGERVALRFYEMGYQAFVCTYTTNPLGTAPLMMQPAQDLAQAICQVRKNATQLNIDPQKIILCGFSAGAHVVGTVGVHADDLMQRDFAGSPVSCRPDAMLLCYPVICMNGEIAHAGSVHNLLGQQPQKHVLDYMSLEQNVTPDCPPVFLWHTRTDQTVPVENSMAFTDACKKTGVPCEAHYFSTGPHGLALGNEMAEMDESSMYTFEQVRCVLNAMENGALTLSAEEKQRYMALPEVKLVRSHGKTFKPRSCNGEVQNWTTLADHWLKAQRLGPEIEVRK